MKARGSLVGIVVATVAAALLVFFGHTADENRNLVNRPPLAPSATPGEPVFSWGPTSVLLAQPLTEVQALGIALKVDADMSRWERPWSLDTVRLEPGRITIEEVPSRTAEGNDRGENVEFAPEIETDAGSVWRITIRGNVRVGVLSPRVDVSSIVYDGVTYVISARTGNLLAIVTGKPIEQPGE